MKQENIDIPDVIVNKSGCPEIELLANSVNTSAMGRQYIVQELIAAGFKSIKDVASINISEISCMFPDLQDLMPGLHAYACNLLQMGF